MNSIKNQFEAWWSIKIKTWGFILILIATLIIIGIAIYTPCTPSDKPMFLKSVCTGQNTNTVKCVWIPLEEKHRTIEEKEIAKQASKMNE